MNREWHQGNPLPPGDTPYTDWEVTTRPAYRRADNFENQRHGAEQEEQGDPETETKRWRLIDCTLQGDDIKHSAGLVLRRLADCRHDFKVEKTTGLRLVNVWSGKSQRTDFLAYVTEGHAILTQPQAEFTIETVGVAIPPENTFDVLRYVNIDDLPNI